MNKQFSRDQLLDLVWQTPMTELASKFGLSDNGLRKIYKKHQIPTPPMGYWTKVKFGKSVPKKPKLTPLKEESTILLSERETETESLPYISQYYKLAKELKKDPNLDFEILDKIKRYVEEVRFVKSVINKTHPDSKNFGQYGENRPPFLSISLPKNLLKR